MEQVIEQQLSPQELQQLRNNRTGLFIFQLSWILVFISLIVVNLQLRSNFPSWPPPGIERLPVVLPLAATAGLVASSILAQRGLAAFRQGDRSGFRASWAGTALLGLAFVAIMAYEWLAADDLGQYGAMFRVMTGFHTIHAVVIGLYLLRTRQTASAGTIRPRQVWPVEAGVRLWNFVTIAWAMFFVVLYII